MTPKPSGWKQRTLISSQVLWVTEPGRARLGLHGAAGQLQVSCRPGLRLRPELHAGPPSPDSPERPLAGVRFLQAVRIRVSAPHWLWPKSLPQPLVTRVSHRTALKNGSSFSSESASGTRRAPEVSPNGLSVTLSQKWSLSLLSYSIR